jgi:hypothetical protein
VVGEIWLETALDDQWRAASRLAVQNGRPVIAEVRVFPHEPGDRQHVPGRWSADVLGVLAKVPDEGLTARGLRKTRLGEYPTHAHEILKWLVGAYKDRQVAQAFAPNRSLGALGLATPEDERPRPKRNVGRPDLFYARLATARER